MPRGGPDGGDGGNGGDVVFICDPSRARSRGAAGEQTLPRPRGQPRRRVEPARGPWGDARDPGASLAPRRWTVEGDHDRPGRGGPAGDGRPGRSWRPRGQSPHHLGAAGAALRRERTKGSRLDPAAAEAARRRRPGRVAERGQDSLLSRLTKARRRSPTIPSRRCRRRWGRSRRAGGGARRHPRADRRGGGGRRARARVPAHVERCSMLVHLVELTPLEGEPSRTTTIGPSSRPTAPGWSGLPELVVLLEARPARTGPLSRRRSGVGGAARRPVLGVVSVSSATGEGLEDLRRRILAELPVQPLDARPARRPPGGRVRGRAPRLPARRARAATGSSRRRTAPSGSAAAGSSCSSSATTPANEEALAYLEQRLTEMGVIAALRKGRLRRRRRRPRRRARVRAARLSARRSYTCRP